MINITVLAVGKVKDRWLQAGIDEYVKRLGRYAKVKLITLPDSPDHLGEDEILKREGEQILKRMPKRGFRVLLDLGGEQPDSVALADKLGTWAVKGDGHIVFIIGGSHGLADDVRARADYRLALSEMTFTHLMTKLILLEQIYRAFRIRSNEPYHK